MATLCKIRQEIHELLNKHKVQLVVEMGEFVFDRSIPELPYISVVCNENGIIGSTALY
jgi:hypothetical protein